MFNSNGGYSLSDIAAVSGRNGGTGFGDGEGWWIILLFLFALNGGWGNGFGGNRGGAEDVAYSFDMNGLENGVRGIQQGLCDGFYAVNTGMLNGFNGIQNTLCQGFSGINDAITNSTIADMQSDFALQTAFNTNTNALSNQLFGLSTQIADCCCKTQTGIERGFSDLGYAMATQASDTRRAITDSTREIIDFLTQDKIAALTAENQTLKFAASQQAQNSYLVSALRDPCPVPAYVVPNPNCCYGNYSLVSNNCGC